MMTRDNENDNDLVQEADDGPPILCKFVERLISS